MLADLRLALRALRRAPGFTFAAALTLALGLGAATAVFTLLDAVVLRPLPYARSERLVRVQHAVPGVKDDARWGLATSNYFYYGTNSRTLDALAVFATGDAAVLGGRGAERVPAAAVSPDLFPTLGMRPALGRLFTAADARPGAAPAAVLGHALWARSFGADPRAVGRTVTVDGRPVPVVGVLPAGADLPGAHAELWTALTLDPAQPAENSHYLTAVGRLRPGFTPEDARAELAARARRLAELFPSAYSSGFLAGTGFTPTVTPLKADVVGAVVTRALWVVFGAVGLLLVVAAANVGNLFVVRAEARRREAALRAALGGTRAQLARRWLAEGLVLAGGAAAVGLGVAALVVRLVVAFAPGELPRVAEVGVGWSSVAAALVAAVVVGAGVGLLPIARYDDRAMGVLRAEGRGLTPGGGRVRLRGALVTAQVALAVVLLAGAGLMLRSVAELRRVPTGIAAEGVLAFDVALPGGRYGRDTTRLVAFYRDLTRGLEALPGVRSAAVTTTLPYLPDRGCSVTFVEGRRPARGEQPPCVATPVATPEFFRTLGIPLRGRAPAWDAPGRPAGEVVVTEALARRLWPGEDALGKGVNSGGDPPFFRVVGVAADVRGDGVDQPPVEAVYYPLLPLGRQSNYRQMPTLVHVAVRTGLTTPAALVPAARRLVSGLDPEVPIANPQPMTRVVARSMARTSFTAALLGAAAASTLVLSFVGLYGVLAYAVGARRGEIGVRLALGAGAGRGAGLVLGQSLRLAAAGVAVGLVAAVAATRLLRALLFGVGPGDPATLGGVAVVLLALAALASWLPARRAARVDPAVVLRGE